MNHPSTKVIASTDGSTEPVAQHERLKREATEICQLWQQRNMPKLATIVADSNRLHRNKSLLLKLALADYEKDCHESRESIRLRAYCQRYSGLGESLETSILRQLEVKKYLDEHPELLDLENQFAWPEPFDEFLNFTVIEELGRGALARVYLCEQQQLGGRSAVVKIAIGRSANEPALLGKLRHRNIMTVQWADYDEAVGASYICMPFLGRNTLADLIRYAFRSELPRHAAVIKEVAKSGISDTDLLHLESHRPSYRPTGGTSYVSGIIRLATDLADALTHAHTQHVIHGDIKPSNVLLSPEGVPLLFDFNLGCDKRTRDAPVGGTLAYMAPEQLRVLTAAEAASCASSEIATDIYSFGTLLYELVTGSTPYDLPEENTDSASVATQLLIEQEMGCPSVVNLNPEVDRPLAELISSCLAFDPGRRPATMQEVRDTLARQTGILALGRRQAKAHPLRTWLLGIGLLGLLVATGVAYHTRPPLAERLHQQAADAREEGNLSESIALLGRAITADPNLHAARLERAICHLESKDYVLARDDLMQLVTTTDDPKAMAYYAYSFNLTHEPDTALHWYQRALKNDLRTAGILNNLSVSLLTRKNAQSMEERLTASARALEEALQLKPTSPTIRMNALRLAIMSLQHDHHDAMRTAIEHADWLCREKPNCAEVWTSVFMLYHNLADQQLCDRSEALFYLQQAIEKNARITREHLETGLQYAPYRQLLGFAKLLRVAQAAERNPASETNAAIGRFMDPLVNASS